MQINMSVVGKIGEKLAVTANFDNNNSFDFQNNMKVEYTGYKEDILQKLEIGNVSLPLNNTLIQGAQNLFGIKAKMQFGKLDMNRSIAGLSLDRMSFDIAFLGADAVAPDRGVGEPTVDETVLKEQVAAVAHRTAVLADVTKVGVTAPAWTRMPGPWSLLTDTATADLRAGCASAGVELLVPEPDATPS